MDDQIFFHPGVLEERDGSFVQIGRQCNSCGKTSFPASEFCKFCSSEKGETLPLSKIGTLFSFSVTRVPVGPYKPPIISGFIDLPEGARVFGQIHADVEEVRTGMRLSMETGVIWTENDGIEVIGYYYVPCAADNGGKN